MMTAETASVGAPASQAARHQHHHDQLPHDIGRHQREIDPVERARDAVLHMHHAVDRQADAGEQERHDGVIVEPGPREMDGQCAQKRGRGRDAECHPAAAGQIAAQFGERAAFGIFRNETLRGGGETEIGKPADQHHPGPDIDEDAEFVAAHPARQRHLRAVSEHGADDADQERGAGDALRDRAMALIGKPRARICNRSRDFAHRLGNLGTAQCHVSLPVGNANRTKATKR